MFTVVGTVPADTAAGTSTATVYSGPAAGATMRRGQGCRSGSTKGGQFGAYGDLTAAGGMP
jgi:hypothetical protein